MGANAVTTVPVYTAGEVLTAADLNITNSGIPVFATSVTRDAAFGGTGEKTLAQGQYAYIEATSSLMVYSGSAWINAISSGLNFIKSQVIGSAVASVTVSDAFSATYDAYMITISGGVGSTGAAENLGLKLGASTTGYYSGSTQTVYTTAAVQANSDNNGASWTFAGTCSSNGISLNITLLDPFLSSKTKIQGSRTFMNTTAAAGSYSGWLNDNTSYTAFTLTPGSGTLTGGTIRIYGLANS